MARLAVIENTPAAWSERAAHAPTSLEAVGWTAAGQAERFAAVLDALQPQPGELLLDYGCGTGALSEFIYDGIDYVGVDWADGMIARAAAEHPGRRFTTAFPGHADLVACVGTFNLPGHWSKEHTWHAIRWLWDMTGCRSLAVSLYAGEDERCLIYTPREARRCARNLGYHAYVRHSRHNDLLLEAHR